MRLNRQPPSQISVQPKHMQRRIAQKARCQPHPPRHGRHRPPSRCATATSHPFRRSLHSPVPLHIIVTLGVLVTLIAIALLCVVACPRAPRASQRGRAPTVPGPMRRHHHRRHLMHYLDGRARGHARTGGGSQSFSGSLKISPSQPAIFAIGKDAQRCVKVVLTPPTPARAGGAPGAR